MKKIILISLIVGITLIFGSLAMAGQKPPWTTNAPTWGTCIPDADSVYLDWDWAYTPPKKYAVEVELLVSGEDWDDPLAEIQKLSFGTGDRDDGLPLNETSLDIPLSAFVYWDGDSYEPFYGDARAKVKALNPPSKYYTQKNKFSVWCEFTIEEPAP